MTKTITRLLAAATLCALPATADAASIIKKIQTVSTFDKGPRAKITNTVEFSFDPDVSGSAKLISFTSDGGSSFADPVIQFFSDGEDYRRLDLGRGVADALDPATSDFDLQLYFDATGGIEQQILTYALPSERFILRSSTVLTDLSVSTETGTGAVPEPATWALMLAGFGLTATALRRRRVRFAAVSA
ncbi:PEPxxWA-CTERM sorting domain-containing protein [Sphingomonas sp. 1P08PE]|uniref:PEPxxWA-CTERM sorting domain-containing protein n=1 Tax=Sphingomonas sp. 1P08PE TaxID=554122 RepID=UPI0039A3E095